jgi:hypothetical protein
MRARRVTATAVVVALGATAGIAAHHAYSTGGWPDAVALGIVLTVVAPCVAYFVLGPTLFGAVVSLPWPRTEPPRPGRCPGCRYDLRGNADPARCPECGRTVPAEFRAPT